MSIPRALGFDDDEIVGGGGGGSNEKFSKSKKSLALGHAFYLLRLAFTDTRIVENDLEMFDTKITMQSSWRCLGLQDLEVL